VIAKNLTSKQIKENVVYINDIRDICREAQEDPNNFGKQNYALEDNQRALLYMLLKGDRFSNGVFTLLYDDDYLVAFAGAYELNKIILMGLVRAYTRKKYRAKVLMGTYILPEQIKYAKELGYEKVWLTFNEYNLYLYNAFKRIGEKKSLIIGNKTPEIYNNMYFFSDEMYIQNTWQKVIELQT
jgi:hypothetical protein